MGNDDAAKAYFVKALELGVAEAEVALAEVAKNRNVVTKNNNKQ
jgi:hypothetical protein